MEGFAQRECVLSGFSAHSNSPPGRTAVAAAAAAYRNSSAEFHDVFGGPPRNRSSIHEFRYSFGETLDSSAATAKGDDEAEVRRSSWQGLSEKPVFGGEVSSPFLRRHRSDDFFSDIFRLDESDASTPKKLDWDSFASLPGSRGLSPARPLSPKAGPLVSSSLPAQFSLPAKLAKGIDLPAFGPNRYKEANSNRTNYSSSPSFSTRFSSQGHGDLKNDLESSYHPSPLHQEHGLSSEEPSSKTKSDETDNIGSFRKELNSPEDLTNGEKFQFHFSIYKWGTKGVPLGMHLGRNGLRLKERMKIKLSSSSDDGMVSENNARPSPTSTPGDIDFHSNDHLVENTGANEAGHSKEKNDLSIPDKSKPLQAVEESIWPTTESENKTSHQSAVEEVVQDLISHHTTEGMKSSSFPKKANEEVSTEIGRKQNTRKRNKRKLLAADSKSLQEQDKSKTTMRSSEVVNAAQTISEPIMGKNRVSGKLKAFMKMFDQETSSKPKVNVDSYTRSSRWKQKGTSATGIDEVVGTSGKNENVVRPKSNDTLLNAPIKLDRSSPQSINEHSPEKTSTNISSIPLDEQNSSASETVPVLNRSKSSIVEDTDESYHDDNFLVVELLQDENEPQQTDNSNEETKAIDAKIRQWSRGKEENIRSMLSTLQFILWPASGWKPVPLVDIIEANSVKRAYQKALLCLHPDKLQQKGAEPHQKYLAHNVFEILQDAWNHFNTVGAL